VGNQKQIEPTAYDKECMEALGKQAQAIERITRYVSAFQDYHRRLIELSAAKRRFEEAEAAMSDYDKEVYMKMRARMLSDKKA